MKKNNNVIKNIALLKEICGQELEIGHVCDVLGIRVIDSYPLEKEGYLICMNGIKKILVSSKIKNKHKRKFILGHEVGHFMMHGKNLYSCECITEGAELTSNSSKQEAEANNFASELLLSSDMLREELPITHLNFSIIKDIASKHDISVTMTAIKAVQNSKTCDEMLICYENNELKWFTAGIPEIKRNQIPNICPAQGFEVGRKMAVNGYWDGLYEGTVYQELFSPCENQILVLLAGNQFCHSSW